MEKEAVLGPLVGDLSLTDSIFVVSYDTLGLLCLVNTSFSVPNVHLLSIAFSLFHKVLLWSLSQ